MNQPRKDFHFCQCWKGSSGCWTFLCSLLLTIKLSYTNVPFSVICTLSYFSFCSNEWLPVTTKNPCVILTSDQQSHSFQVKIFSTEEAMIFSWGYFMVGGEDVTCIVHTSIRSTLYTTVWFPNSVDEENNWLPCLGQGKPYLKTMNYMYSTYEPATRNIVLLCLKV